MVTPPEIESHKKIQSGIPRVLRNMEEHRELWWDSFLIRESGATVLSDTKRQGSIPLLDSLIWPHGR
jgi:hypothetical protein